MLASTWVTALLAVSFVKDAHVHSLAVENNNLADGWDNAVDFVQPVRSLNDQEEKAIDFVNLNDTSIQDRMIDKTELNEAISSDVVKNEQKTTSARKDEAVAFSKIESTTQKPYETNGFDSYTAESKFPTSRFSAVDTARGRLGSRELFRRLQLTVRLVE
jgi:hypothetical protein